MSIQERFLGNIFTRARICLINGLKMISCDMLCCMVLLYFGKQADLTGFSSETGKTGKLLDNYQPF